MLRTPRRRQHGSRFENCHSVSGNSNRSRKTSRLICVRIRGYSEVSPAPKFPQGRDVVLQTARGQLRAGQQDRAGNGPAVTPPPAVENARLLPGDPNSSRTHIHLGVSASGSATINWVSCHSPRNSPVRSGASAVVSAGAPSLWNPLEAIGSSPTGRSLLLKRN